MRAGVSAEGWRIAAAFSAACAAAAAAAPGVLSGNSPQSCGMPGAHRADRVDLPFRCFVVDDGRAFHLVFGDSDDVVTPAVTMM